MISPTFQVKADFKASGLSQTFGCDYRSKVFFLSKIVEGDR